MGHVTCFLHAAHTVVSGLSCRAQAMMASTGTGIACRATDQLHKSSILPNLGEFLTSYDLYRNVSCKLVLRIKMLFRYSLTAATVLSAASASLYGESDLNHTCVLGKLYFLLP